MAAVGIDLVAIARIERAIGRRPNLALRLFTEHERAYAAAQARPGQHLAARFCVKEAVIKALGLSSVSWQEIEVRNEQSGAPVVRFTGSLAEHDGSVAISLTHTGETAGAVAIVI